MIKWTEKTVKVSALKPFERNPRRISEDAFNRLKKSLQDNGYHQRIIATIDLGYRRPSENQGTERAGPKRSTGAGAGQDAQR